MPSWTLPIIFLYEFMNHKADIPVTFLPRNKHRSVATHLWFLFLSGGTHEPLAVFHGTQGTRWSLALVYFLTPWSLKQGGREPHGPCFYATLLFILVYLLPFLFFLPITITTTFPFFSIPPYNCPDYLKTSPKRKS